MAHSLRAPLGVLTPRSSIPAVRCFSVSAIRQSKPASKEVASKEAVSKGSSKPLVRETSESPEELNSRPLPYLSFALGVPTPPSATKPTWSERREKLISHDHRMASRKAIVKEATRGYFHDFHAIKSHGGKTWRAPNTLIKDDRALWFPRVEGTRLSDKNKVNTVDMLRGKVSIIALLGSKISEEHTRSTYKQALDTFATHPAFQLVQVSPPKPSPSLTQAKASTDTRRMHRSICKPTPSSPTSSLSSSRPCAHKSPPNFTLPTC